MTARLIMDPEPIVLRPDSTISTAIDYIMKRRYRSLPVVDAEGCFLGIFGVNCLLRLALPKAVIMEQGLESATFIHETLSDIHRRINQYVDEPISLCMQRDVPTVTPDTSLIETLLILYRTHASLPVVEAHSCILAGMVSYWDAGRNILAAEL